MQATTPLPRTAAVVAPPREPARRRARALSARRALARAALAGIVACSALLATGGAGIPTRFVPASQGGFPGWLSGPLHGIGWNLSSSRFELLVLVMSGCYLLVLIDEEAHSPRALLAAILGAHLALLLGPVLLSADAFGYLSYARLGALHGLDPYTHAASAVPSDAVFGYLGWHDVRSPYGPLFTLGSYGLVPLGVAGGIWAIKTLAVVASLATVALVARAAQRLGRAPLAAAAFVGLNPVLLVFAVAGAHNDTLLLALSAAALAAATAGRLERASAWLVAAAGIKASASLVLPFMLVSPEARGRRAPMLAAALVSLAVLALVAIAGFGPDALGFLDALRGQQHLVAAHSIPYETARALGLHHLPGWLRASYVLGFALATAIALWRVSRGADWRAGAAWATLALLLSTAWLLPWYAVWMLPLAALVPDRRLRVAVLAFCAYALLIRLPLAAPLLGAR